jgi:flagellar basal-body rod protein FlgC
VSFDHVMDISGSGLKAQMMRMEVLSANIANLNATRTPEGGPYRRKDVIMQSTNPAAFENILNLSQGAGGQGVEVSRVVDDPSPFMKKYEPQHPDAGPDGFVLYPNVNVVSEMVNLQEAARSYDANISVLVAIKSMITKTFEIGR